MYVVIIDLFALNFVFEILLEQNGQISAALQD